MLRLKDMFRPKTERREQSEDIAITFEHLGEQYTARRVPLLDGDGKEIPGTQDVVFINIYDEQQQHLGQIAGSWVRNTSRDIVAFASDSLTNTKLEYRRQQQTKLPGHKPGIVRETIAQLIVQGIAPQWKSSRVLLDGGVITYEALLRDKRLSGKRIKLDVRDSDTGEELYQYVLKKK